jgi:hypothetical protein
MLNKVGIKVEYQSGRLGFLLGAARYFDLIVPHYPGNQFTAEFRYYHSPDSSGKYPGFIYTRFVGGNLEHRPSTGEGFFLIQEVKKAMYLGFGIGVGKRFTRGNYFAEFNGGIKAVFPDSAQKTAFYVTGPGAFLDLHLNLGYRF